MKRLLGTAFNDLGADEVEAIISTSAPARDGHILRASGCDHADFDRNPIILWAHSTDQPVGRCERLTVGSNAISARIRFAPLGVSETADRIRGLVKSGVVSAMSISFLPDYSTAKPIDPKQPRGGQIFSSWTLLEASFVAIPSDIGAVVTARADRAGKVLSGVNAEALKTAHDHAEACRAAIADVLDGAGEGLGDRSVDLDYERRKLEHAAMRLRQDTYVAMMSPSDRAEYNDWLRRHREAKAALRKADEVAASNPEWARRLRDAARLSGALDP